MQIKGSTVLLTGASGGLGGAIARELSRRGARLVLTARSEAALEELAAETGDSEVVVADLTDRGDLDRLCTKLDDIDILVANAGVGHSAQQGRIDNEAIDFVIDVNLRAPMILANAFASRRIASDRKGQIVMIGSLSGLVATANSSLYNATKFGLRGFSLAIRQDYADLGVGVSLVAPGFIHSSGMFAHNDVELPRFVRAKSPQDVAAGVVKAIASNPAEVYVSPVELRATATLGTVAPGLSEAIQRKLGVAEMSQNG